MLYRLCNGFALFRDDESGDQEHSPFRLLPLHELQTFRHAIGEDDEEPMKIGRETSPDDLVDHPDRLRVFDLGNGDFLSCVCAPEVTVWIDDWREGPTGIVSRSVAEILSAALAPDCLDPATGCWTPPWWR